MEPLAQAGASSRDPRVRPRLPPPRGTAAGSSQPSGAPAPRRPSSAWPTCLLCSEASCQTAALLHMLRLAPVRDSERAACLSMVELSYSSAVGLGSAKTRRAEGWERGEEGRSRTAAPEARRPCHKAVE